MTKCKYEAESEAYKRTSNLKRKKNQRTKEIAKETCVVWKVNIYDTQHSQPLW